MKEYRNKMEKEVEISPEIQFGLNLTRRIIEKIKPVALKPHPKCLYPMDVGATWLMIEELGGKVTDGYGKSLDEVELWKFDDTGSWSTENQISWIAASSPELHKQTIKLVEEGFAQLPAQS